jgi:hypothetical protein
MGKMHPLLYNLRLGCWPKADGVDEVALFNAASGTNVPEIATLVSDIKSFGIWNKITHLYPFVGTTATSQSINLRDAALYPIVFAGGTHVAGGYSPDGSGGGTFPVPAIMVGPTRSVSMGYMTTSRVNADVQDLRSNTGNGTGITGTTNSLSTFIDVFENFPSRLSMFAPGARSYMASHGPVNGLVGLGGTSTTASRAVYSFQDPTGTPWTIGNSSTSVYNSCFFGTELTLVEMQGLTTILDNFNVSLGR